MPKGGVVKPAREWSRFQALVPQAVVKDQRMHCSTLDELKQKRTAALLKSQKAILQQVTTYRELKKRVHEINNGPLDVADYYRTATELGALLLKLCACENHTIFHYFAEHIHPGKAGDVRCFRLECRDLADQIKALDMERAQKHRLKRVK
jgi:hypothetical protein